MTRALVAKDALAADVRRVGAEERPDPSTTSLFAVFENPEDDGPFLGLVTSRELARHPRRIFADLVPPSGRQTIPDDSALEPTLRRMQTAGTMAMAVVGDDGRFAGAVTRESVIESLLMQQRTLVAEVEHREAQLQTIYERSLTRSFA